MNGNRLTRYWYYEFFKVLINLFIWYDQCRRIKNIIKIRGRGRLVIKRQKYSIENINTWAWQKLGIFNYTFIRIDISYSSNLKHHGETMSQNNLVCRWKGITFISCLPSDYRESLFQSHLPAPWNLSRLKKYQNKLLHNSTFSFSFLSERWIVNRYEFQRSFIIRWEKKLEESNIYICESKTLAISLRGREKSKRNAIFLVRGGSFEISGRISRKTTRWQGKRSFLHPLPFMGNRVTRHT